jgi:DNA polymerase-1
MYLTTPTDKYWVIDIEGNDLFPAVTRIWCAVVYNIVNKETVHLVGHDRIKEWFEAHEGAIFIGHNILGYDMPALNKVLGLKIKLTQCIDTMLMSMFYNPSMDNGHSLDAWGRRLLFPKQDHTDFSQYSARMLEYCENDTLLCYRIYKALVTRMRREGFTEQGIELEHKSWYLVKQQQRNGFPFNFKECTALFARVHQRLDEIKEEVYRFWPPQLEIVRHFKQARKKDGTYTKGYLEHQSQYVRLQEDNEGGYYAYDYVEFNLASPVERRDKLLELGWIPKEFTKPSKSHPNGQAKVTDKGDLVPSLVEFVEKSGKDEVRLIATWIDYNSRAIMLNTWMENYNHDTGRIHGNLWLANTLRYRHSNPNTANIPAVRLDKEGRPLLGEDGAFTYEARDLWTCSDPSTRSLVGVDAKGIQLRVLAHHLNNPEFMEAVVNGDPHTYNQKIGGIRDRPTAKTFI